VCVFQEGCSRQAREKSLSPVELSIKARTVRVGSFKGIPVEPILISKNGLNFFIEGNMINTKITWPVG